MLNWVTLTFISAFLLGCYDIAKKKAVSENAVPIVLLATVSISAVIYLFPVIACLVSQDVPESWQILVIPSATEHLLLLVKAVIVSASWICAYYAIKHLPLSIAMPIRTTSPVWTIVLATCFVGERPDTGQWIGMLITIVGFLIFSRVGAEEGIRFRSDRWVWLTIAATGFGAISGIYDKYLLQTVKIAPVVVQAWFSIYLVPVMIPSAVYWLVADRKKSPFQWRWSIPMISLLLLAADFIYFTAISDPDAMISVISPLRRTSVIVAFVYGIVALGEKNWRHKAICISIILFGAVALSQASITD
ncbi:MAG: EamA family transporter [Planctomycetota bacterium]